MAILIDQHTQVLIQGITGATGSFQTKLLKEYGTKIVAGVTPGKGGQVVHGVPVYNTVCEAVRQHHIDAAMGFVPRNYVKNGALEALENDIKFVVVTSDGVPYLDMIEIIQFAKLKGARVVGPDTAGVISPGKSKLGGHPHKFFREGSVGILSKSGALSYEVSKKVTEAGLGQSTVVAIGGGPFWGSSQLELLELFNQDVETNVIVLIGEVGGTMEFEAAEFIKAQGSKPVIAMIVGRMAPEGAQMGHAGAIVEGGVGSAAEKIAVLKTAGVHIAYNPGEICTLAKQLGA